ncbi:MAG: serine/threonine protein kinase [Pyrinomonadaceae bacterium]|nr:serine/threonine protein kinase [Pyrinomonadaceae bacterium]
MFQENDKIGPYKLVRCLGIGGFGEVWLAKKRSLFITKEVAIKLPLEKQVDLDEISKEAILWEQASGHPNVLPIIDADIYDGQVAIVSEYVEGGSLHDRLQREGRLSVRNCVEMTVGVLKGLEYLHNKGIIHRDLKPQNILLQGNTPRIADFGISRAITSSTQNIAGTPAYMAPEAFDGQRNVQTDIWAVGIIIYQMLFAKLPFSQKDFPSLIKSIIFDEINEFPHKTSPTLQLVLKNCLAKNPNERFQNVSEILKKFQSPILDFEMIIWGNEQKVNQPNKVLTVDSEQSPRKQHYTFAHVYLREKLPHAKLFIENITKTDSKFLNSYWVQSAMYFKPKEDEFLPPEGLCAYPFKLSSSVYGAIIQLPPPIRMAEAFFVAVVLEEINNSSEVKTRYITLELSANRDGSAKTIVGEWRAGSHANYGTGPEPTPELFLEKVQEMIGI